MRNRNEKIEVIIIMIMSSTVNEVIKTILIFLRENFISIKSINK